MNMDEKVRIMFFGDFAFNISLDHDLRKNDFNKFKNVRKLFNQADLIIGNLESPLPGDGSENMLKIPRVIANPDAFELIKELSPDILCLANNHIYDALESGFKKTTEYLSRNNILYLGAGFSFEEARSPLIVEKNSIKIGLLNYVTEETNPNLPEDCGIRLNFFELNRAIQDLKDMNGKTDIRIVLLHWGMEYCHFPTPEQQRIVKFLSNNGADVIVGHHTHTIQPIQRNKKTLIAYSLGNFYFPNIWFEGRLYREWSSEGQESMIIDVIFTKKGIDGFDFHRTIKRDYSVYLEPGNIHSRMKWMHYAKELLKWNTIWKAYFYLTKGIRIFKNKLVDPLYYRFLSKH